MKSPALIYLLGAVALVPMGCNKEDGAGKSSAGTSIGVVDLDKLGKAMGWNDEMKKNLDGTESQIGAQLNGYLKYRQDELEAKKKDIVAKAALSTSQKEQLDKATKRSDLEKLGLTPAQIDELIQASANLQNEAAGAKQRLEQIKQAQYQAIVKAYQEAAQPSIRRVALANNKQVIVQPLGALYTDPQVDLTDRVVDDLQHSSTGTNVNLPPIPKLNIELPEKAK